MPRIAKQRQRLQAAPVMRIALSWRNLHAGQAQTIAKPLAFRFKRPLAELRQPRLDQLIAQQRPVQPKFRAGLIGEAFDQELIAATCCLPGDPARRVA